MTICTTQSGPYRCLHEVDEAGKHAGACEAQAKEYAKRTEFVARNGFWWDLCEAKKHGLSKHASMVVDGAEVGTCIECQSTVKA